MFGRGAPVRRRAGWVPILLAATVAVPYLLAWGSPDIASFLMRFFALDVHGVAAQPWAVLTYPLAYDGDGRNAINVLLLGYWLYSTTTMVERELGSGWTIGIYVIGVLLHGIAALLGGAVIADPILVWSSWLPTAFMTIVWCARNQSVVIRLFLIIPVSGRLLAALTALLTMLYYGTAATYGAASRPTPLFGIIVILPLILAWAYGLDRLPLRYGPLRHNPTSNKKTQKEFDQFITKVRDREKEREERDRLRKLFEDSLDDENPPK